MKSVSIIIPAWNEESTLKATLYTLLNIDYDKKKCEVIVVAGGRDKTYEMATSLSHAMEPFLRYVVLRQKPGGKNAAIQLGFREANNAITVLLDADTIVSQQWLKSMIDPIEQNHCDLTIANPEPARRNWVSDYYMINKNYFLNSITTFSGHSMAFEASIVRNRLEYFFDKDVKVGVDYLLAKRFLEDGRKIMFAEGASVITHVASSFKYFVLTESRWLSAVISIDGVSYRSLACNATVIAALIFVIPVYNTPFILSLLFNTTYVIKKIRMFLVASRRYRTRVTSIPGYIMLSYANHVIGLISYIKYFLGLSKEGYLYQGQRY
jgi:cellulose synthase/poly-beta-1,6-N-acetylglucosamine synthase-like glycosyltransferase